MKITFKNSMLEPGIRKVQRSVVLIDGEDSGFCMRREFIYWNLYAMSVDNEPLMKIEEVQGNERLSNLIQPVTDYFTKLEKEVQL